VDASVKTRRGRGEGGEEGDKRGRRVFKRSAACGFGLGSWGSGRIGDRFVLEVNSDSVLKQKEYLIICHVFLCNLIIWLNCSCPHISLQKKKDFAKYKKHSQKTLRRTGHGKHHVDKHNLSSVFYRNMAKSVKKD
jgi:hypothetical protein